MTLDKAKVPITVDRFVKMMRMEAQADQATPGLRTMRVWLEDVLEDEAHAVRSDAPRSTLCKLMTFLELSCVPLASGVTKLVQVRNEMLENSADVMNALALLVNDHGFRSATEAELQRIVAWPLVRESNGSALG
eukprot:CAMPEP_0174751696 /NCGR_PEP_ID=MMETSP1094-20130205/100383_1 /TAXON_ID=156173 /ORGANISM="Chrysochromulina brevifilum, Strain UTEX LB 985" /LENGTH=133 /DNA_ID=CAMNT_0015957223 /DNA_START=127 /DNA_END=524 /DNA_ORIENTATION=+